MEIFYLFCISTVERVQNIEYCVDCYIYYDLIEITFLVSAGLSSPFKI